MIDTDCHGNLPSWPFFFPWFPPFNLSPLQFILILTYIPTLNRPANRVGPLIFYNYSFVLFFLWQFLFCSTISTKCLHTLLRFLYIRFNFINYFPIIAIVVCKSRFWLKCSLKDFWRKYFSFKNCFWKEYICLKDGFGEKPHP